MKGTVLLVTLWLLAILSLLAIGIGFRTTIDLRLVSYQIDNLKAYEIAKAGIIMAINELAKDISPTIDTIWECGITLEQNETFDEKFRNSENTRVGEGHFDISYIEDIQGRININSAPRDILVSLLSGVANAGEVADNIRAWRGDKDIPAAAINRNYSDKPYLCKDAPFDVISELLLVKDITPESYNGENEGTGLKDIVTVFGPGTQQEFKININTAGQRTIEALLEASGLSPSVAVDIVEHRGGDDKNIETTNDNIPFTSAADLETFFRTAEGRGLDPRFANFSPLIVFNSSYFKIRSAGILEGRKSNISRTITCVVKREIKNPPPHKTEIISWIEE